MAGQQLPAQLRRNKGSAGDIQATAFPYNNHNGDGIVAHAGCYRKYNDISSNFISVLTSGHLYPDFSFHQHAFDRLLTQYYASCHSRGSDYIQSNGGIYFFVVFLQYVRRKLFECSIGNKS